MEVGGSDTIQEDVNSGIVEIIPDRQLLAKSGQANQYTNQTQDIRCKYAGLAFL